MTPSLTATPLHYAEFIIDDSPLVCCVAVFAPACTTKGKQMFGAKEREQFLYWTK